MTIETIKGQTEKELRGRLNQLNSENFQARFSTEQMSPAKGATINARRREVARIHTVLHARAALARRQEEVKQLELRLAGMKQPHEGSVEDKRRRSMVALRLSEARRAVRELSGEAASAPKPAKAEKPAAKAVEKAAEKVADKPAAKAEKPEKKEAKADKPAKEAKAEPKKEAKKEAKKESKEEKPKAKKKADK